MKLRSLFLFGAGVVAGLAIARKMTDDEPEVLHGPRDTAATSTSRQVLTTTAQKLANRATVVSLGAIRKTRGAIQQKLGEGDNYDDAAWS